jgi:hypothetical protein
MAMSAPETTMALLPFLCQVLVASSEWVVQPIHGAIIIVANVTAAIVMYMVCTTPSFSVACWKCSMPSFGICNRCPCVALLHSV